MLIKEETIQNLEAQHRELYNQQKEYVKKIQNLEETVVELKKETNVLNENVRLKLIKICWTLKKQTLLIIHIFWKF